MYVSHKKAVACRVEILKGLRAACFGTLVTFGFLGIYGENLHATFAKKCAKFRHGSIATSSFLGRLGYLLSAASFRLPATSDEFRVASFLGLIQL